jgi:phospholipid/cholesterol/gamma-HCH transport system ATP-binding protein
MIAVNDTTNHPVVEFQDVSLAFDEKVLLDHISFTIPRGEMRILIGPSKSGKSTILKLAIGLLKPDTGRIFLDGRDITDMPEEELFTLREQTGVVLQSDALFAMNVAENVSYRLSQLGFDEAEIEKEVHRVLQEVGLDETERMMPDELSGGMSRRAAVARALAGSPKIMFYDSPCSGLDPITSRRLLNEIIRLRDHVGVSSLYITQTLDEVRYLCSRIYDPNAAEGTALRNEGNEFCISNTRLLMLSNGKFIYEGPDEGFWKNEIREIREFLA